MVKGDLRSVDGAWRISSRTDGRSDIEYESFVDASVFIDAVIRQGEALQGGRDGGPRAPTPQGEVEEHEDHQYRT